MKNLQEQNKFWTMGSVEENFSYVDLLQLTFWADILMHCKDIRTLTANYNSTELISPFRITTSSKSSKSWFICYSNTDYLENIMHYLHLNISFIEPKDDFNGSVGWYNHTHSSGPLKLMVNNQIDFIINDILMTDQLFQSNLFLMTKSLNGDHKVNFMIRKQTKKFSVISYSNVFNSSIWLLLFVSILFISGIISLNICFKKISKEHRKNVFLRLSCNLIFDYLNMLMSKHPSNLLKKLTSRHYLMYFIPILSIFIANAIMFSFYSHMISPQKNWCQSLECFANSNDKFYSMKNGFISGLVNTSKSGQLKKIFSRLKLQKERG